MATGQTSEAKKPRAATPTTAPSAGEKTSHTAFREFMQARQAAKPGAKPVNAAPLFRPVLPTQERLGKADRPRKTDAGHYRAPPPIERLRDQGKLDRKPRINEAMHTAAITLATSFYKSGLAEHIKGQDLTGTGGGQTTAASYMPVNEFAAHHRQKYQAACKAMGWHEAFPYRGCGRLVVDVICHEHSIRDASRIYFPETRVEAAQLAAMDRLREGLFALALHWRLI